MSVFLTRQVTFSCLVHGEGVNEAFPIKISKSKSVGELRDRIWEKRNVTFGYCEAVRLTLWRVDQPITNVGAIVLQNGSPASVQMVPTNFIEDYITTALPLTPRH